MFQELCDSIKEAGQMRKEVKDKKYTGMPNLSYGHSSRYMCDVLDEMRSSIRTLNFSYMLSLVEEAQVLANRMEGGLSDVKGLKTLAKEIGLLKDARKKVKAEVEDLITERDKLIDLNK